MENNENLPYKNVRLDQPPFQQNRGFLGGYFNFIERITNKFEQPFTQKRFTWKQQYKMRIFGSFYAAGCVALGFILASWLGKVGFYIGIITYAIGYFFFLLPVYFRLRRKFSEENIRIQQSDNQKNTVGPPPPPIQNQP